MNDKSRKMIFDSESAPASLERLETLETLERNLVAATTVPWPRRL